MNGRITPLFRPVVIGCFKGRQAESSDTGWWTLDRQANSLVKVDREDRVRIVLVRGFKAVGLDDVS